MPPGSLGSTKKGKQVADRSSRETDRAAANSEFRVSIPFHSVGYIIGLWQGRSSGGALMVSQPSVRRRMEILFVEDTLEDARTTILALQNEPVDCRISLVRDGEEAMKFLHREGVFAQTPNPT